MKNKKTSNYNKELLREDILKDATDWTLPYDAQIAACVLFALRSAAVCSIQYP